MKNILMLLRGLVYLQGISWTTQLNEFKGTYSHIKLWDLKTHPYLTSTAVHCWWIQKWIINYIPQQIRVCKLTSSTNPTMRLFHIPQCTIQNRNVHISVLKGALWDMEQAHCGVCELVYNSSGSYHGWVITSQQITMRYNYLSMPWLHQTMLIKDTIGGC